MQVSDLSQGPADVSVPLCRRQALLALGQANALDIHTCRVLLEQLEALRWPRFVYSGA